MREQHHVIRDCKLLAISVQDTVRASYPLFSRTAVRLALKFHTHSLAYLRNLAAGGYRYDLAGQPWGLVTPEHQQQAQEKLKKLTTRGQVPTLKSTPRGSEATKTPPVETGDAAGPDAVILRRLKEMRPTLRLKPKEERP